jgi:hypothetical protein
MTLRFAPESIELWPLDRLRPYAGNAKTHGADQVARIAGSMAEFGWTMPVLVSGDGEVIAGHGRILAAEQLGLNEAPVIVLDHLSEAQRRAYRIADNKLTELGDWDEALLSEELQALSTEEFDLSLSFDDLGNSGTVGSFEHFDQRRLLTGATLDHGRHRENVVTFGRRNFLGLAKRGISQRRCAKRDGARVLVVPPDGIGIVGRDLLDQAALQQTLEHIANGAALDVGGDGEDEPILTSAGAGQDDGLGFGKFDLMHGGTPGLGRRADRAFPTTRSPSRERFRGVDVAGDHEPMNAPIAVTIKSNLGSFDC